MTELDKLIDLFETHHNYDIPCLKFKDADEITRIINCIQNKTKPKTDLEFLLKMKYTKVYDKKIIFQIMMKKQNNCALLMFSTLCSPDDKQLYID